MIKLGNFTKGLLKNTVGYWQGKGRIYNIDRDLYLVGFAEVNPMASTAFARIRVNKGWVVAEPGQIVEGDLIQDKADAKKYLVMSIKNEVLNQESVYWDATLYLCDSTASIERWTPGTKDVFGRPSVATPSVIAADVPIMTNPRNFDVVEQQDRVIAQNKISVYLQAKVGVQESDRIKSSNGEVYKVVSVDRVSLMNIHICYVDVDVR